MANVKMKTIDYGTGDVFVISPDWENVDKKPEHLTSWGHEHTTYSDTLLWSGNTEGLEFVDMGEYGCAYRVSDAIPTVEDFANGATLKTNYSIPFEITADDIIPVFEGVLTTDAREFCVVAENAVGVDLDGITFPGSGIYFLLTGNGEWTNTLTINGYNLVEKTKTVPLPNKYLGIIETVMGDTLTWDGDTEGLETGINTYLHSDGPRSLYSSREERILYRISEVTPSYDEIVSKGYTVTESDGYVYTVEPNSDETERLSDSLVRLTSRLGVVAYEDNVTLSLGRETFELPKKGIYVYEPQYCYVNSLKINGYTGFTKEQVKEEYLPPETLAGLNVVNIDALSGTCDKTTKQIYNMAQNGIVLARVKWKIEDTIESISYYILSNATYDPDNDAYEAMFYSFNLTTGANIAHPSAGTGVYIDTDNVVNSGSADLMLNS